MGKLQRPLDPEAVEAADENLYAAHGSDPRPNALYDADGNQIPLDGSDPALNQEWETQYNKALKNKAPEPSDPASDNSAPENVVGPPGTAVAPVKPPPTFGPQPVGCATQQCAKTHWIKIDLLRDVKDRPKWWVKDSKTKYPYEPYSAKITSGPKVGALDSAALAEYDGIPAGSCSIKFTQFYKGIVAQLETGSFVPVTTLSPDDKAKKLVLTGIDSLFAPGVEVLNIKYDIHNLESDTVTLEIESAKALGKILFQRELSADEKVSGDGKLLSWDGKASAGAKGGNWIGPEDSPYVVRLKAPNDGLEDEKQTRVEIYKIELEITAPKNKIILNVPETKIQVKATVQIKKKAGGGTVTPIDIYVVFTYIANGANTSAANSFAYNPPLTLGKGGDAGAVYWAPHAEHPSTTPDNYNKTCKAEVISAAGAKQGTAKTWFKPSGVGGNKYKVKAEVFASDGTTSLAHKETAEVTIWRKVVFSPYEMDGTDHVRKNGTHAIMAGFYTPDIYVEYELGKSNIVPAPFNVKYIGLWDHATQKQLDWAKHSAKTQDEIPEPTDVTDSNGGPGQARDAARKAIQAQAEAWRDRIMSARQDGHDNWAVDAGIPADTIIGIVSDHPKFSANADKKDAETSEWTACPWLKIEIPGVVDPATGKNVILRPDDRWNYVQGYVAPAQRRAYIFDLGPKKEARTRIVIAHEVGHATKLQFERKQFGVGDHTAPAAGLMDRTGSKSQFTAAEKDILRGHK
jgi:hypothetical protein